MALALDGTTQTVKCWHHKALGPSRCPHLLQDVGGLQLGGMQDSRKETSQLDMVDEQHLDSRQVVVYMSLPHKVLFQLISLA